MASIGIIGIRGQALRWANAANASGWNVTGCYHPDVSRLDPESSLPQTDDLQHLLDSSDVVVVASPSHTHLAYMQKMARDFKGVVVVEKPIVMSASESVAMLDNLPAEFLDRVYVNHHFRVFPWVRQIQELLAACGSDRVISAELSLTHDLAFKPEYKNSWRSRIETHPIGPAETQGIHLIDLVHCFFGAIDTIGGQVMNLASTGAAPDTATMTITTQNRVSCAVHTSYAAPTAFYVRIVTTDFVAAYKDGVLTVQNRPQPKAGVRSVPPRCEVLQEADQDELAASALTEQLKAIQRVPDTELCTARQAVANVLVLGGFSQSLETGDLHSMKNTPMYEHNAILKSQNATGDVARC